MSSRKLRDALVAKQKWTKQQLSARVSAVRKRSPMSTQTAQAVVAHHAGLNVAKYLQGDELREVREAISAVGPVTGAVSGRVASVSPPLQSEGIPRRNRNGAAAVRAAKVSDPILPAARIEQAKEMARSYIVLHVLENSMREVIQRVMRKTHGTDWWDSVMSRGSLAKIREKATNRQAKEQTARWHQTRGDHPLDYTDLGELGGIIMGQQAAFFPLLGVTKEWFQQYMLELEPSRNVVCHMNRLKTHNVQDIEVKAARWSEIVQSIKDEIAEG